MFRAIRCLLLVVFLAIPCFATLANDIQPEVVKRAKQASALVVLPSGRGFGSAFCIDPTGYFLTNDHVIKSSENESITLVLNAGDDDQKILEAVVVRTDGEKHDLALLRVKTEKPLTHLEFGKVDDLVETQQVIALGYPFGTALKVKEKDYPNISINVGRITALRRGKEQLERIQLDAQVNQGNSGGPVIDTEGKVIGVVQAGILRSGVNFAIPVSHAVDFLRQPGIVFQPPKTRFEERYDQVELTARVTTFIAPQRDYDVKLILGDGESRRTIVAEHGKGDVYLFRAGPLVKPDGAPTLAVEISFQDGLIRGAVEDQKLAGIEGIELLSGISRIQRQETGWTIAKRVGDAEHLDQFAPQGIVVSVGGQRVAVNFAEVRTMNIYEPPPEADRVPFELVALEKGETVATIRGEWTISANPLPPAKSVARNEPPVGIYRPPMEKPKFEDEQVTFKVPSVFASAVFGGSGRYIILHMKEAKKVAIFDILVGKIVHEIPDVSDDVLMAAGREKFFLVLPGDKLMQRWSFKTFSRERVAALPGKGTTLRALMGRNSDGPLLLGAEDAALVDIETMEPLKIKGGIAGGGKDVQIHVSANGQTFGAIPTGYGPVAFIRVQVKGDITQLNDFSSTSNAIRWSWPTADGTLMTGSTGIFGPNLEQESAQWLEGCAIYPTVDPRYFLAVRISEDSQGQPVAHVNVCTTCDRNIVYTYVGLEELAKDSTEYDDLPQHQIGRGAERFIYVPWANLLVTLPKQNDRIVLRRFDMFKLLDRSGQEYLFVDSIPPHQALIGHTLRYQVEAKSKAGGVTFRLETGPEGMTVTPEGLVNWNVPSGFAEQYIQAIVAVKDNKGKEILHSFRVRIAEEEIPKK